MSRIVKRVGLGVGIRFGARTRIGQETADLRRFAQMASLGDKVSMFEFKMKAMWIMVGTIIE